MRRYSKHYRAMGTLHTRDLAADSKWGRRKKEGRTVGSIFDSTKLFTQYRVEIEFRDKLMGGTPKDANTIEAWLAAKLPGLEDAEFKAVVEQTFRDIGVPLPEGEDVTYEQALAIAKEYASTKHTNGFKVDPLHGLYIEGRAVKAMLRESCNILFAGERWGKTKKGPKAYLAERVFVPDLRIPLGRSEPDGIEQFIGHVSGPQGPQSTLTYYEYVWRPTISFRVMSAQDCITPEQWMLMLIHAQENGLGSVRSQSYGTFDVTAFERLEERGALPVFAPLAAALAAD